MTPEERQAPEPVSDTDPKLSDCDHTEEGIIPKASRELEIVEFAYCPKCGEKL